MEEDNSVSSVYFMLAVNSHVSMQGHHCLPLKVWCDCELSVCYGVTPEVVTQRETKPSGKPSHSFRGINVYGCVCVFLHPLSRVQCGGKDKGDKAKGLSALLNMTWSSELRHELDSASIITSFLQNLVVGPVNVWNCEVGRCIQASSSLWLSVIITFTDPLSWLPSFLFKLYSLPPGFVSQRLCIHRTLSVLESSHPTFKQVW